MVFALAAFGFMACNDESVQLNTNEPEVEINLSYEEIFAEIASSLGLDVTFETVDVFYGLCPEFAIPEFELDRISTRSIAMRESWDIDNSLTVRATTSLGNSVTTITTPHMDNPNAVSYVIMSSTGEAMSFVADVRFNEINGTMSFELMEEMGPIDVFDVNGMRWRDNFNSWHAQWADCFNGVLTTPIGTTIAGGTVIFGWKFPPVAVFAAGFFGAAAVDCAF